MVSSIILLLLSIKSLIGINKKFTSLILLFLFYSLHLRHEALIEVDLGSEVPTIDINPIIKQEFLVQN